MANEVEFRVLDLEFRGSIVPPLIRDKEALLSLRELGLFG